MSALELALQRVTEAMAAGLGTTLTIGSTAALETVRRKAEVEGWNWYDGVEACGSQQPFGCFRRALAGTAAGELLESLFKLRREAWRDPSCPMLPDAPGSHRLVARSVHTSATPTCLVLRDTHSADDDTLAAVQFLARYSRRRAVSIVLVSPSPELVATLERDAAVITDGAVYRPKREPARDVSTGVRYCDEGALTEGSALLSMALRSDPSRLDARAQCYLAMSLVQQGRMKEGAGVAAECWRASGDLIQQRRARRVWLASRHTAGDAESLSRCLDILKLELGAGGMSVAERAWGLLDAAMAASIVSPATHYLLLETLLALPRHMVPKHALVTAEVWAAAAAFNRSDVESALEHQERALVLLNELEDFLRGLHLRARMAGCLLALQRYDDALPWLHTAVQWSLATGDTMLAARLAADAVRARCYSGAIGPAVMIVEQFPPTAWCDKRAELIKRRIDADLLFARREFVEAASRARDLFEQVKTDCDQPWRAWLATETAYLLGDICREQRRRLAAATWFITGLEHAHLAGLQDRFGLLESGRRRLSAVSGRS